MLLKDNIVESLISVALLIITALEEIIMVLLIVVELLIIVGLVILCFSLIWGLFKLIQLSIVINGPRRDRSNN